MLMEKPQDVPGGKVTPAIEMSEVPAVAVIVPGGMQVVADAPFGVAMTRPAGSVPAKPTPVSAVDGFGFVIVKLSAIEPPSRTDGAANERARVGGAGGPVAHTAVVVKNVIDQPPVMLPMSVAASSTT